MIISNLSMIMCVFTDNLITTNRPKKTWLKLKRGLILLILLINISMSLPKKFKTQIS